MKRIDPLRLAERIVHVLAMAWLIFLGVRAAITGDWSGVSLRCFIGCSVALVLTTVIKLIGFVRGVRARRAREPNETPDIPASRTEERT